MPFASSCTGSIVAFPSVISTRWPQLAAALGLLAALAGLAWLLSPALAERAEPAAAVALANAAAPTPALPPAAPTSLLDSTAERRRQLLAQVQLTAHTYCAYHDSSIYPFSARPIGEQPDQVYPNAAINETNPMRKSGGGSDPKVLIQTSQTRVYLAAGEAVSFSVRAVDGDGAVLALVVTGASAAAVAAGQPRPLAPTSPLVLTFLDDGSGADPVAGDGAFAATLAPAATSLAGFNGTIRTLVHYSVAGQNGSVSFDVIYSASVPAVWSGPPREVVEEGALHFYLPLQVRQPGRYVVSGRVDDAAGKPFALLSFNEPLAAGPATVRLSVFGKLLHDLRPVLPLTLRDVDAYLLKENSDPDRVLLARREGPVLTGKAHPIDSFADAEWQGEQRQRNLAEFARDAQAARAALASAEPLAALPAPPCALPPSLPPSPPSPPLSH